MASHPHLDEDDDFGGDFPGNQPARRSGSKRSFGDIDDEEDDIFGPKKGNLKVEETAPGVATGMILSLRESLQNCKDTLATCQLELEAAKSEIQRWHSAFQNEPFIPAGVSPQPKLVVSYLQNVKMSEESLREQLEKAKKKEAAFIVTVAKREQEISDLKSAVRDLRAQLKPPSMQNLVEEKDKKVKELQDNVAAVNFTPQSKMGKMLMAKCRTLQEENEEIGNQAKEGKMHELSMRLALQKSQNVELRSQFEGLCKHMDGLTNDVEKSNEMGLILQQRLEEKDDEIKKLKQELQERSIMEDKTELASDKNVGDQETIPREEENENL
ncbi:hypothetical protein RJ639_032718 [Escallonia herrerae]|uniref:FKBP12-interacting protein of 37 kDa n=1 Tax=Escallonia herrerae TaxID=1293975 RepID=A0AA88WUQ2_9ASTE|nr:hypothetical protein RJ639_032718 [Escallonia herrerae]